MKPSPSGKAPARRWLSLTLIALGAVLIVLAPQTWPGGLLLALGVLLELIGMAFGDRRRSDSLNQRDRS